MDRGNNNEQMEFPDTWEEFEEFYGFYDTNEVYTNGSRLIPSFRVKQWLEHHKKEPCDDCISRQAVIDTIDKWVKSMHVLTALPANEVTPLFESVHELPSVTPQPKMGRWTVTDEKDELYSYVCICSECSHSDVGSGYYCRWCGAKMQ